MNKKYTQRDAHLALRSIITMSKAANSEKDEVMNKLIKDLGPDIVNVLNDFEYLFNVLIEFIPEEERHFYENDYEKSRWGK
ncbi:hypothetical protein VXJ16_002735 [Vibrio vulnificus]|nr:hypothetical protein [Vibrio vulnificus]